MKISASCQNQRAQLISAYDTNRRGITRCNIRPKKDIRFANQTLEIPLFPVYLNRLAGGLSFSTIVLLVFKSVFCHWYCGNFFSSVSNTEIPVDTQVGKSNVTFETVVVPICTFLNPCFSFSVSYWLIFSHY